MSIKSRTDSKKGKHPNLKVVPKNPLDEARDKLGRQRVEVELATRDARVELKRTERFLRDEITRLKTEGYSHDEIADELGIGTMEISLILRRALDEYLEDRDEAVKEYLALVKLRYDRIFKTWLPRAEPQVRVVKDEETGEELEIIDPPDPEAARIILTAQRDIAKLFGTKVRLEHTGLNGGAIDVKVDVTQLSDDQIAAFRETKDVRVLHALPAIAGGGRVPPTSRR